MLFHKHGDVSDQDALAHCSPGNSIRVRMCRFSGFLRVCRRIDETLPQVCSTFRCLAMADRRVPGIPAGRNRSPSSSLHPLAEPASILYEPGRS